MWIGVSNLFNQKCVDALTVLAGVKEVHLIRDTAGSIVTRRRANSRDRQDTCSGLESFFGEKDK